jgi:UPF0755 protein
MPSSRFSFRRLLSVAVIAATCLAAAAGWAWWQYARAPLSMTSTRLEVDIERGLAGQGIGNALRRQGVTVPGWMLSAAMRLRGDAPKIRAGSYELIAPISLRTLLDRLTRGDASVRDITFIEGWNIRQVRLALSRQPDLRLQSQAMTDAELLAAVGAPETHPEGLFAPDSYSFAPGTTDIDILRRAYRLQRKRLDAAWQARPTGAEPPILQSPYQLLVLASIIEKETGRESDRARVASVFVNRLKRGMMLQSDPTTIYGMGEAFDGNLRRRDLKTDTPYNTYTRNGLPPTPIAMPGSASIAAALNPARSEALYFVARGDGSSEFSDDLAAHNRAVARYQKKVPDPMNPPESRRGLP